MRKDPAAKSSVFIETDSCKGCEFCVFYCPKKVLAKSKKLNKIGYNPAEVVDAGKCNSCGTCYIMCPEYAIEVRKSEVVSGK